MTITHSVELDNPEAQRPLIWVLGFIVALLLHVALILVIMSRPVVSPQGLDNFDAISVDLDIGISSLSDDAGESPDASAAEAPDTDSEETPVSQQAQVAEQTTDTVDQETDPADRADPDVAQNDPVAEPASATETPEEIVPELPTINNAEVALPTAQAKPEIAEQAKPTARQEKTTERPRNTRSPSAAQTGRPARRDGREAGGAAAPRGGGSATGVFTPHPAFPRSARVQGISYGRVTVRFTISPTGSVSSVRIMSSSPAGVFDSATTSAVSRWRFTPPGSPVTRTQTFHFVLR